MRFCEVILGALDHVPGLAVFWGCAVLPWLLGEGSCRDECRQHRRKG